jgi:diguanylate cyclase (GGDEF)-like protein
MAHPDGLTNLASRALFRQHLEAAMADFRRTLRGVALLFFDLHGFKKINDTLGHPADRVRQCAGDGDTVARLGGDESTLYPAVPTAKDEQALARELVQRIAKPFDVGGNRLTVTASIGISSASDACSDSDRMLHNADVALYRGGSGRVGAAQGLRGCRCLTHLYRPGGEHLAVPMHPALTQTVMNALATSRLTPGQLELEITETALLQDSSLGATSVAGARRQNLHGTISAPAIPRSVICEAFRSTRSRSTRAS